MFCNDLRLCILGSKFLRADDGHGEALEIAIYLKKQIDNILVKDRFRNPLKACKAYPCAECGNDQNPFIAKVQLKLRKLKKKKLTKKFDFSIYRSYRSRPNDNNVTIDLNVL